MSPETLPADSPQTLDMARSRRRAVRVQRKGLRLIYGILGTVAALTSLISLPGMSGGALAVWIVIAAASCFIAWRAWLSLTILVSPDRIVIRAFARTQRVPTRVVEAVDVESVERPVIGERWTIVFRTSDGGVVTASEFADINRSAWLLTAAKQIQSAIGLSQTDG